MYDQGAQAPSIHVLIRTLGNPELRDSVTSEKNDCAKFLSLRCLVCKNFAKSSFTLVTKFRNAGLPLVMSQMD